MKLFSSRDTDSPVPGWRQRLADLPAGVRWGALAALVLAVVLLGWLGVQAMDAKSHLEQARGDAVRAKDALLSGKSQDATRWAENAQFHARQAQSTTRSGPWALAALVPVLGSPLKTTQQISDVVVGLADEVLLPAARMGAGISPENLVDGMRVNLRALQDEQPGLAALATSTAELDRAARNISEPAFLSVVSAARSQLLDQTRQLSQLLGNASIAAQLAPPMMGADGPRTYLLAFQSNAESRGTGGMLGGFGVLRFEDGTPSVDMLAKNTELSGAKAAVDLGPEFDKVYGWMNPYSDFRNSNLSAHFPYAAEILRSMWESESGQPISGVIALDPITLSYILGAVGPVTLPSGEEVNQSNVVELTLSTAYRRFPTDQTARKEYLQEIAKSVVTKMTGELPSPKTLLAALGKAAGERRILVWSAVPREQELLEQTPLAHTVPDDSAPYAQVVLNNLAGNKMDYYLKREIEYAADGCGNDVRNSTVTVKLTNTAQPDEALPDYVAGTLGLDPAQHTGRFTPPPPNPVRAPPGTMITSVRLLATKGAQLLGVSANGEQTPATTQIERGRPNFEVQVAIPPGQSGELTFRLREPTNAGEARTPVQPLADSVAPRVSVPTC